MIPRSHPAHMAPVATMLHPSERGRVDAMGAGLYRTIHRESLEDVLKDLRLRRIGAVVVSAARCGSAEQGRIATVVREFPRVPTLAILSTIDSASAQAVLTLGNSGVRTLVDVRQPAGWNELRALLSLHAATDLDRGVIAKIRDDLDGASEDCWRFFEAIFSAEYHAATVRQLAQRLGVLPSTLMSRFFRAQLPAPKRYLAYARLIRAARLFENPGLSVADVANHLDYSSPQSFGRHIRTLLHATAVEFRLTHDGERMAERFRTELILPYSVRLRAFSPLTSRAPGSLVPSWQEKARMVQ